MTDKERIKKLKERVSDLEFDLEETRCENKLFRQQLEIINIASSDVLTTPDTEQVLKGMKVRLKDFHSLSARSLHRDNIMQMIKNIANVYTPQQADMLNYLSVIIFDMIAENPLFDKLKEGLDFDEYMKTKMYDDLMKIERSIIWAVEAVI